MAARGAVRWLQYSLLLGAAVRAAMFVVCRTLALAVFARALDVLARGVVAQTAPAELTQP